MYQLRTNSIDYGKLPDLFPSTYFPLFLVRSLSFPLYILSMYIVLRVCNRMCVSLSVSRSVPNASRRSLLGKNTSCMRRQLQFHNPLMCVVCSFPGDTRTGYCGLIIVIRSVAVSSIIVDFLVSLFTYVFSHLWKMLSGLISGCAHAIKTTNQRFCFEPYEVKCTISFTDTTLTEHIKFFVQRKFTNVHEPVTFHRLYFIIDWYFLWIINRFVRTDLSKNISIKLVSNVLKSTGTH